MMAFLASNMGGLVIVISLPITFISLIVCIVISLIPNTKYGLILFLVCGGIGCALGLIVVINSGSKRMGGLYDAQLALLCLHSIPGVILFWRRMADKVRDG